MSRIACVWADLGSSSATNEWYEDTHIPKVTTTLRTKAHHAEQAEDNMFKEVPGIQGDLMTVYKLPDSANVKDLDAQIYPALNKLSADARIETRYYKEHAKWFGKEWRDDPRDVQMWIVVLWQPVEAMHDQFVTWFREEFAPGMLNAPELLRTRIFTLDSASVVQDQKREHQNTTSMYQYLTLWEFNCDDLPWEILVYLGSSERWRFYVEGGHLNWQIAQYLVNRLYLDEAEKKSSARHPSVSISEGTKRPINEFLEVDLDDGEEHEERRAVRVISTDQLVSVHHENLDRAHIDDLQGTAGISYEN